MVAWCWVLNLSPRHDGYIDVRQEDEKQRSGQTFGMRNWINSGQS